MAVFSAPFFFAFTYTSVFYANKKCILSSFCEVLNCVAFRAPCTKGNSILFARFNKLVSYQTQNRIYASHNENSCLKLILACCDCIEYRLYCCRAVALLVHV